MAIPPFTPLLLLQERAAADNCRGLNEQEGGAHDAGGSPIDAFAWGSIVLGKQLDISSEFDRRLSIGASIACRLRGAIRKQLGECSTPGMLRGWHHTAFPCLPVLRGCRMLKGQYPMGKDTWKGLSFQNLLVSEMLRLHSAKGSQCYVQTVFPVQQ